MLSMVAEEIKEFNQETKALIKDLQDTLEVSTGIGLAAPQIGVSKRAFVIKLDDGVDRVFINPQIAETSAEMNVYEEGCLSIPGVNHNVVRPKRVTIYAYDENGKPFHYEADGLLATCIQHENDHLDGKLYIDHLTENERKNLVNKYEKMRRPKKK